MGPRSTIAPWSVSRALAAIDVQDLSGHERRRLEIDDSADHILDLADPTATAHPQRRLSHVVADRGPRLRRWFRADSPSLRQSGSTQRICPVTAPETTLLCRETIEKYRGER